MLTCRWARFCSPGPSSTGPQASPGQGSGEAPLCQDGASRDEDVVDARRWTRRFVVGRGVAYGTRVKDCDVGDIPRLDPSPSTKPE